MNNTGLDQLFRIYLLGWYCRVGRIYDYSERVYVTEYQDIEKAVALLPARFKNWELDEIIQKLYYDLEHVEAFKGHGKDDGAEAAGRTDYAGFMQALVETDRLYPGIIDKMYADGRLLHLLH